MHEHGRRSPARLLAPLALILFTVALAAVVLASVPGDDGDGGGESSRSASDTTSTTGSRTRPRRAIYTVKTGDTLGSIAQKTGVTVERLQELNPELDPQALLSGQQIRLRE
jgi:LysM repeat protein